MVARQHARRRRSPSVCCQSDVGWVPSTFNRVTVCSSSGLYWMLLNVRCSSPLHLGWRDRPVLATSTCRVARNGGVIRRRSNTHPFTCHSFTCHSFTCHSFASHAFTPHAFTSHSFTCHSFTCHSFASHAFTPHAFANIETYPQITKPTSQPKPAT